MSNTITIELCAEDRARLDHINVNLTELIMRVMGNQAPDMGEVLQYKLEDIQQKVVALSASGKKAEVREIVKSYAEKVSAIPADKFGEVMAKLIGLEG